MKHNYTKIFLLGIAFLGAVNSNAQVSIGDQAVPDAKAVLDLSNTQGLGLLLPKVTVNPNAGSMTGVPEGLMIYYKENFFLKGPTTFNTITPWKCYFTGTDPIDIYFNPTGFTTLVGGVGIGLTSGVKGNLHVALKGKDVNVGNTKAPLLIGESDGVLHMEIDNDEIMVKATATTAGTLKLQEGGGTVQVGKATALVAGESRATLNVIGEIQQHGYALVPVGGIIMWTGTVAPDGWALCNGAAYTKLAGGSITAPDLRERFIVGAGTTDNTTVTNSTQYAIGAGGNGNNTVALSTAQMASHSHTINHGHGVTDPGHTHTIGAGVRGNENGADEWTIANNKTGLIANSATTGITVVSHTGSSALTGSGSAHENRPPYYALAFIMKL